MQFNKASPCTCKNIHGFNQQWGVVGLKKVHTRLCSVLKQTEQHCSSTARIEMAIVQFM